MNVVKAVAGGDLCHLYRSDLRTLLQPSLQRRRPAQMGF